MLTQITDSINKAGNEAIGKISHHSKRTPVPWWNEDCRETIKQSKTALYKLRRQNTLENLLNFKRFRAKARYTIKKARESHGKNMFLVLLVTQQQQKCGTRLDE